MVMTAVRIVNESLIKTKMKGETMTVWLLAIDREHSSYEELKYRKVLAQGWSAIGDLSPLFPVKNEGKFREIITNYVSYVYGDWVDKRDPGRIILNLSKFQKGDYVICCEGQTVRGVAKLTQPVEYHYDNPRLYEYAQVIYPVTSWVDLSENDEKIKIKSMGPVGIQKYGGDPKYIASFFEELA